MADLPRSLELKKPADKLIAGVIAALVIGIPAYGLFVILPYLITLAENVIILGAELAVIVFVIAALVSNWTSLIYAWKNISRNIRRGVVRDDPMGVLRTVQDRFTKKLDEIDVARKEADAAVRRLANSIGTSEQKATDETGLCNVAQQQNRPQPEIIRHATAAQSWQRSADGLKPKLAMFKKMLAQMQDARDLCQAKINTTGDQMQILQIQLDTDLSSQKAVKSFKRFFGNNADLEIQGMALDEIERQSTEAEAEIDEFLRQINPALQDAELKKQADAQAALAKFNFKGQLPTANPNLALADGAVKDAVLVPSHAKESR